MAVESSVVVVGETVDECSNGRHIQKFELCLAMLLVLCVASIIIFGSSFGHASKVVNFFFNFFGVFFHVLFCVVST